MGFYTDRWMIIEKDESEILLFRKSENSIIMERIVGGVEDNIKENICHDILEEYDIGINASGQIYFLYQNQEMNLILKTINKVVLDEIKLTKEAIPEVYELKILVKDKDIHIIYCMMLKESENYIVYHHYYNGKAWETYMPEEIQAKNFLNPFILIDGNDCLELVYIEKNKNIMIKKFDLEELKWDDTIELIDTHGEKIFLDVIKLKNEYHFTYCEYVDENLVVKYEKFLYEDGSYRKKSEDIVSNEGASSYPILILYNERLWVIWVELNKLLSRYYDKESKSWSDIFLWEETKTTDFLRYRYLTQEDNPNIILNYAFGKVYPEVKFLGFGSTENTQTIPTGDYEINWF